MSELIKKESDWKAADAAYAGVIRNVFQWAVELSALSRRGYTGVEMALRYDKSEAAISQALAVGADKRFSNAKGLPRDEYSLYLLTTLDDAGFKELAKPDTTRAKILEYKRRLAPPPEPTRDATWKPVVPPRVGADTPLPGRKPTLEEVMWLEENGVVVYSFDALDTAYNEFLTKCSKVDL